MRAFTRADYEAAAGTIHQHTKHQPTVGLILGSGLGDLVNAMEDTDVIAHDQIPLWPRSTVQGHVGRLVLGCLEGQTVMALQGRVHFYEGYSVQEVTFPVRVMQAMGINTLIVTNAAGGLNPGFAVGDLMLITDHLNLVGIAGHNPLIGPNDDTLGLRFPEMTTAYDRDLAELARKAAQQAGFPLREGVYAYLAGPSFETPAEIRMLRMLGADAVGMSTVPEVIVARHARIRVLGVSGITNVAVDTTTSHQAPNHQEVLEAGMTIMPKLAALIRWVLASLKAS